MKKLNDRNLVNNTSFHAVTVKASVSELISVLGEPSGNFNDGEDKVNYEWEMQTEQEKPFTVYDWKEYRPLSSNEQIVWHIGGHDAFTTMQAAEEMIKALELIRN